VKIQSESRIHHPLERVYSCYRDQLPEIAPYTPDIKEIVVHSREELEQGPKIHNEWIADRDLPKVESFIVKLITPNLEKVNHSLERYLDAQG
jgi:hypothetical protein